MPRLAIDQDQARDIAAYLAQRMQQSDLGASSDLPQQAAQRTLTPQRLAQGRALFAANNCGACHAFEKPPAWRRLRPQASTPAERLAPDLRYTRDRMTRERIVAWLEGPRALLPNTLMPDPGLAVAQVELMTDYLLHAPRNDQHHPVPARLPPLDRPVSYAEVEDRILRKVCWHCHSQPDLARGDGGPGMSGGFGYPGRKIDLSTYGAVLGGYEERDGTPVSVFRAGPSGAAILLDVLLQRQREVAGESTSLLGMPLGLPPLPPEDIQLVESWIAQGRPQ
jgi:cytochrome c2